MARPVPFSHFGVPFPIWSNINQFGSTFDLLTVTFAIDWSFFQALRNHLSTWILGAGGFQVHGRMKLRFHGALGIHSADGRTVRTETL